jgi:hypothetical protein
VPGYSRLAIIGALVSLSAFALAAVLYVADSSATSERLGLLFALFGTIVAGLLAALRSDAAATSTNASSNIAAALNGAFDSRVRNAIRTVSSEPSTTPIEPVNLPNDPSSNVPAKP